MAPPDAAAPACPTLPAAEVDDVAPNPTLVPCEDEPRPKPVLELDAAAPPNPTEAAPELEEALPDALDPANAGVANAANTNAVIPTMMDFIFSIPFLSYKGKPPLVGSAQAEFM